MFRVSTIANACPMVTAPAAMKDAIHERLYAQRGGTMRKRKTLRERAASYLLNRLNGYYPTEGQIDVWLAGYRACQRDRRKP